LLHRHESAGLEDGGAALALPEGMAAALLGMALVGELVVQGPLAGLAVVIA
jgi:hypothetical protein